MRTNSSFAGGAILFQLFNTSSTVYNSTKPRKMGNKKRKRGGGGGGGRSIHPRNKYADNPPDFSLLASLYPSFSPFVSYSPDNHRPRIDWTDFNATRELTRVLLLHDHSLNWYFSYFLFVRLSQNSCNLCFSFLGIYSIAYHVNMLSGFWVWLNLFHRSFGII